MKFRILCSVLLALGSCLSIQAQESTTPVKEIFRVSIAGGKIHGQVFTIFDDEKTPLAGRVSLTDIAGNAITSSVTDDTGKFSFDNVEPGKYKAVGIAGDFVGDAEIEVTVKEDENETGYYTSIPLAVAPVASSAMFDTYASLPAASFSSVPASGGGGGGCSSCGGGNSVMAFGRSGGGGGGGGGGLNFRRLALLGAVVAIPIALSGGNDDTGSPDEN